MLQFPIRSFDLSSENSPRFSHDPDTSLLSIVSPFGFLLSFSRNFLLGFSFGFLLSFSFGVSPGFVLSFPLEFLLRFPFRAITLTLPGPIEFRGLRSLEYSSLFSAPFPQGRTVSGVHSIGPAFGSGVLGSKFLFDKFLEKVLSKEFLSGSVLRVAQSFGIGISFFRGSVSRAGATGQIDVSLIGDNEAGHDGKVFFGVFSVWNSSAAFMSFVLLLPLWG